jgi:hypothetical protein
MNQVPAEPERVAQDRVAQNPASTRGRGRLRFELIFASILLAGGLFGLPAAIFAVGASLLGPYADDRGLGRFYADFFGDLAEPSVRAWVIALGPLILINAIRLVFVRMPRSRESEPPAVQDDDEPPAQDQRRIEPRIGVD